MNSRSCLRRLGLAASVTVMAMQLAAPATAQYFGRNKVQYENFHYQTLRSEHFEIFYYPPQDEMASIIARMAERWNARYSDVLDHKLSEIQPIILYADVADFRQTNVISGLIDIGIRAVTEGMKNRLVLPLSGVLPETDYVLGHEMVHAFQFDILKSESTMTASNGESMPLWFVEGMAEFLSQGDRNTVTEAWLRDAVLRDDLPGMQPRASDESYSPYRHGHALWSYIAARWGDREVGKLFRAVARQGWAGGFRQELGLSPDSLAKVWASDVKARYSQLVQGRQSFDALGTPLFTRGGLNISPALSPDGRYLTFLSRRDIFTLDLYLGDAHRGEIVRRLLSSTTDEHLDALRFAESSGSWSPDGEKLALIASERGDFIISIVDITGHEIDKIHLSSIPGLIDVAWSPDGRSLLLYGGNGGMSDLYLYDLDSRNLRRLTNNLYAELQPTWSRAGDLIAFMTEQGDGTNLETLSFGPMRIALMNVASGDTRYVQLPGATHHLNPQFSPDGRWLYFVADPEDGINDLFRYDLETGQTFRLTHVAAGLTGLTEFSPVLSVAAGTGDVVVTMFAKGGFELHSLASSDLQGVPWPQESIAENEFASVATTAASSQTAAGGETPAPTATRLSETGAPSEMGPRSETGAPSEMGQRSETGALNQAAVTGEATGPTQPIAEPPAPAASAQPPEPTHNAGGKGGELTEPSAAAHGARSGLSHPGFAVPGGEHPAPPPLRGLAVNDTSLVSRYLSNSTTGLPMQTNFTHAEYHPSLGLLAIGQAYGGISVDGFGTTLGGGIAFLLGDMLGNRQLAFAVQANGGIRDIGAEAVYELLGHRVQWGIGVAHIPFQSLSLNESIDSVMVNGHAAEGLRTELIRQRIFLEQAQIISELPLSQNRRIEAGLAYSHYSYQTESEEVIIAEGVVASSRSRSLPNPSPLDLIETSVAYVGDYSFSAYTGPVEGKRYRLEAGPTFGSLMYLSVLADYRHYFMFYPFTFAARLIHQGRYLHDAESDRLAFLYLGDPALIRGYDIASVEAIEEGNAGDDLPGPVRRLIGSRIGVFNLELRLPVLGSTQYGLINMPYVPLTAVAFLDGGVAWTDEESPELKISRDETGRIPVWSTGLAVEANLLGYLVLQVFYAVPFQRPDVGGQFGVVLAPGW